MQCMHRASFILVIVNRKSAFHNVYHHLKYIILRNKTAVFDSLSAKEESAYLTV